VFPDPDDPQALSFQNDVRDPLRRLLQPDPVFSTLHYRALAHYRHRAADDSAYWGRWTREAVYHLFQFEGEAAGGEWRRLVESPEAQADPERRLTLADEVTGTAYIEDAGGQVRPRRRQDGSRMVAPADLILAFYHVARAKIDLARRGGAPTDDKVWGEAEEALARVDQLQLDFGRVVPEARLAFVRAALARLRDRDRARAILDEARGKAPREPGGASDPRAEAFRPGGEWFDLETESADVLATLRGREAQDHYRRALRWAVTFGGGRPPELVVRLREGLARTCLFFDQVADALAVVRDVQGRLRELPHGEAAPLAMLTVEVLLRAGWPSEALAANPWRDLPVEAAADLLDQRARLAFADVEAHLDLHDPNSASRACEAAAEAVSFVRPGQRDASGRDRRTIPCRRHEGPATATPAEVGLVGVPLAAPARKYPPPRPADPRSAAAGPHWC
jgi:hypothetical protein